jgi:enoyl-CoA hydratase
MTFVQVDPAADAEGVAIVTVSDPERRNALTPPMIAELIGAFDRLEAEASVGAVVITGAPPAFCAGADLSHLGSGPSDQGLRGIYEGFLRVGRSPIPTIAAVNGAAVGAGVNLALVCDLRLAARRARFDTRFLQLGLHPGGGHTWMMRRAVGPQTTVATVLFGEVLDGAEAERTGLVWRCVEDDQLLPTAIAVAARAATSPALARRIKATIAAMADVDSHDVAVDVELEAQLWSMAQPEFAARLAAMRDRISSR